MTRILFYAYDADTHCPDCASDDYYMGRLVRSGKSGEFDEHGLPMSLIDSEGNPVHPVFSTDEGAFGEVCRQCGYAHK